MDAPENTVAAFVSALEKSDMVEFDAQPTADGKLVVMHDAKVDRTTDGSGAVSAMSLDAVRALDAGSWFSERFTGEKVPTFQEALASILPAATPLIERKGGSASAYVYELRRLGAITNVVLQAFDWNFLAAVHALEPHIPLCALGSGTFTAAHLASITNAGARRVAWDKAGVNPGMLDMIRAAGLSLFVWTVDGPEIQTFVRMGVDGIISNDPAAVRRYQEVLTNGPVKLDEALVAYWRMNEGLGGAMSAYASDALGTNDALVYALDGLTHWATPAGSKFGTSLRVDGSNSWAVLPRGGALDPSTNSMSLSLWVKLFQLPSQIKGSFGAIFDSTNDSYVVYLDRSARELRFKVTDANGHAARPGIAESLLPTNEWLHIAATYSGGDGGRGGQATIYLNGAPCDTHIGSDSSSPLGLNGKVKPGQIAGIGREGAVGASYLDIVVDDIALWGKALSPSEVAFLYGKGELGLSLWEVLARPSALITQKAVRLTPEGEVEVEFESAAGFGEFQVLHAASPGGPFLPVYNAVLTSLGGGKYRFKVASTGAAAFFRVQANRAGDGQG